MQTATQILGTDQVWFGVFCTRLNQANGREGRKGGEKVRVVRGIEFEGAIKFQHAARILCLAGRERVLTKAW